MSLLIFPWVYLWHKQGAQGGMTGAERVQQSRECDDVSRVWSNLLSPGCPSALAHPFSPFLCRKSVTSFGRIFTLWQVLFSSCLALRPGLSQSQSPLSSLGSLCKWRKSTCHSNYGLQKVAESPSWMVFSKAPKGPMHGASMEMRRPLGSPFSGAWMCKGEAMMLRGFKAWGPWKAPAQVVLGLPGASLVWYIRSGGSLSQCSRVRQTSRHYQVAMAAPQSKDNHSHWCEAARGLARTGN